MYWKGLHDCVVSVDGAVEDYDLIERVLDDAEKARTELGWEPSCSFEQGLQETIEWYRAHL